MDILLGEILDEVNVPCSLDCDNAVIRLFANSDDKVAIIEGKQYFTFSRYDQWGENSIIGLTSPIAVAHVGVVDSTGYKTVASPANYNGEIDWIINGASTNIKYTKAVFQFPELSYFLYSYAQASKSEDGKELVFRLNSKTTQTIKLVIDKKEVQMHFMAAVSAYRGVSTTAETLSKIEVVFEENDSIEFIRKIKNTVLNFFAFICNRKNVDIGQIVLYGNGVRKINRAGTINEENYIHRSEIRFVERYVEYENDSSIISNTINISYLQNHLEEFVGLFASDATTIRFVHPSVKRRRLIDLQHSLQITSAFEYCARTFLPEIMADKRVEAYKEIEKLIDEYMKGKDGKKLDVAKGIKKSLQADHISLDDRIKKAYNGYKTWGSLKPILSDVYGEKIDSLAVATRKWRNELAHEKRVYDPNVDAANGIKLLESILYCIMLRRSSFTDEEIKAIHNEILGSNRLLHPIEEEAANVNGQEKCENR